MGVVVAVSKTFNPYSRGIDYAQEFSGGYFSLTEGGLTFLKFVLKF